MKRFHNGRRLAGAEQSGWPVRSGAVAVEFAVISAFVLVPLIVGMIDVGQFLGAAQKVAEASREGAHMAARVTTIDSGTSTTDATIADVQSDVGELIGTGLGNTAAVEASIRSQTNLVQVFDGNGTAISSGTKLKDIAEGSVVQVRVNLDFDNVRIFLLSNFLSGQTIVRDTSMRRQ